MSNEVQIRWYDKQLKLRWKNSNKKILDLKWNKFSETIFLSIKEEIFTILKLFRIARGQTFEMTN